MINLLVCDTTPPNNIDFEEMPISHRSVGWDGHFCWFFLGLLIWLPVAEGTARAGMGGTAPKAGHSSL